MIGLCLLRFLSGPGSVTESLNAGGGLDVNMISSAQEDSGFPVVIGIPSDNAEGMTCRWNKGSGGSGGFTA